MYRVAALTALVAVAAAQGSVSSASSFAVSITSSASISDATGTADSTNTTGPVTHIVDVAKGGHFFSPDVTQAEVGDIIEFHFYPTNHSVIRAEYGYPCVPYEMVEGVGHYGFFSGFKPVDAVLDEPPTWQVRVNDTDPIFYYCGAPNSCIGYGMVGVINPSANTSLAYQRQLAEQSTFALVPGEDWPTEGSIPSGVAHSSSATSAIPSATSLSASDGDHSHDHAGLSTGAIAGIAIGGSAVLLAAGVAIWFCGRISNRSRQPMPMAPAQEVNTGFNPAHGSMYGGKQAHMSMVSGYSMPPQYDQGMRSPTMQSATPVDPMMGQQQQHLIGSGAPSPNLQNAAPIYGQSLNQNMYSVGTHNIAPVEMSSEPLIAASAAATATSPKKSTEKQGVERYS